MAMSHAQRFEDLQDRLEIVACVDLERERAEAVAALMPNRPRVATDYTTVLELADAALLVLPHDLHSRVTVDCLAAGLHVLVEKPMANTEAECLAMIEAARQAERVLMVAYCMRYDPLVLELRRHLEEQTFGPCFQLSIWTEQLTHYPAGHWGLLANRLGGGQFFSHGCHYVDLLLWLMGRPVAGAHLGTRLCTPWMEKEGTSNVTMSFESGALGYHFGTWGARGSRLRHATHAHCELGMLEIDRPAGKLILHSHADAHVPDASGARQDERILLSASPRKATQHEMQHFLDCIETGATPLTDAVSSLEGLRVIWELYAAEREGRLAQLRGLGLGTHRRPTPGSGREHEHRHHPGAPASGLAH